MKAFLIIAILWFAFCFFMELVMIIMKEEDRAGYAVGMLINMGLIIWAAILLSK